MSGKVMVSKDLKTVKVVNGDWSQTFPASKIESQLAFYRGLAERRAGVSAACYQYAIDGLERAMARVKGGGSA